jgi:hypothetical protein
MNWEAIKQIQTRIDKNKLRLKTEKDYKKRSRLRLKITIDEYRLKLERLGQ